MSRVTAVLATVGALTLGYAVYFDYQRRSNPEFRKKLRKSKKHHEKLAEEEAKKAKLVQVDAVKARLTESLIESPVPTDPSQKEQYFMTEVTAGEQLAAIPGQELEAALHFYKALSIYPNPTDILGIYQKSIPAEVYENIIMMIAIQPPQSVASFLNTPGAPSTEDVQLEAEEQD